MSVNNHHKRKRYECKNVKCNWAQGRTALQQEMYYHTKELWDIGTDLEITALYFCSYTRKYTVEVKLHELEHVHSEHLSI